MARMTENAAAKAAATVPAPAVAELATVGAPLDIGGGGGLPFAVRDGVPLTDALDNLRYLLGVAGDAVLSRAMDSETRETGAMFAVHVVLQLAQGLSDSIQCGLKVGDG